MSRRATPQLTWLARYEDRSMAHRDRAIREIQRRLQLRLVSTKGDG
jgi:hypothetical protein